MLIHPNFNPVAASLGPIKIHWYGIMYLLGFAFAWFLGMYRAKKLKLDWNSELISDLIFYAALGIIIGGRVGYMLFYDFQALASNPLKLFQIWKGGMSFHGGLAGGLLGLMLFAKHTKKHFLDITDFAAPLVPFGLAAGRFGNFINGELWGRPTDVPWAMVFPEIDNIPRHPSQLYEFGLEGVLLFIILFIYTSKIRERGRATALFLICYGLFRFAIEFFREPDAQIGYLFTKWFTMGQLLTVPMMVLGILIWCYQKYNGKLSQTS